MNVKNIFLVASFFFLLNGCAIKAYYTTETDPEIVFDKQKPMSITLKEDHSVADKKLKNLLTRLLAEEGYKIEENNTPCDITFHTQTESYPYTQHYDYTFFNTYTAFVPAGPHGPGGMVVRTVPTTFSGVYSGVVHKKNIGIEVYCNDAKGERTQIWFGIMTADRDDYKNYEENSLRNLIRLMGRDFEGYLDIDILGQIPTTSD